MSAKVIFVCDSWSNGLCRGRRGSPGGCPWPLIAGSTRVVRHVARDLAVRLEHADEKVRICSLPITGIFPHYSCGDTSAT